MLETINKKLDVNKRLSNKRFNALEKKMTLQHRLEMKKLNELEKKIDNYHVDEMNAIGSTVERYLTYHAPHTEENDDFVWSDYSYAGSKDDLEEITNKDGYVTINFSSLNSDGSEKSEYKIDNVKISDIVVDWDKVKIPKSYFSSSVATRFGFKAEITTDESHKYLYHFYSDDYVILV